MKALVSNFMDLRSAVSYYMRTERRAEQQGVREPQKLEEPGQKRKCLAHLFCSEKFLHMQTSKIRFEDCHAG